MLDSQFGIAVPPFRPDFDSRFFYRGFQHSSALSFLERALDGGDSLVALIGATGAGKRATLEYFLREASDGYRSGRLEEVPDDAHGFLEAVLQSFGFGPVEAERTELRNLLSVFLVQVQQEGQRALLHIHGPEGLTEEITEELIWLTGEQGRHGPLRVVLTGGMDLDRLLDSPRLEELSQRLRLRHRLDPLSARETHDYLHFRLAAAGCGQPAKIVSSAVATAICAATGGLPGLINQLAERVLEESAKDEGVAPDVEKVRNIAAAMGFSGMEAVGFESRVSVSLEGETFLEVPLGRDKLLIGRHSFNDVSLRDPSVSRHHAILVPDGGAWVVVDLNSTNGTTVNGRPIRQQILSDGDEIGVGAYTLTYEGGPPGRPAQPPDDADFQSTAVLPEDGKVVS
jgi:type II secretory pathway predicted ATPase ExeA